MGIETTIVVFVLVVVAGVVTLIVRGIEKGKKLDAERLKRKAERIDVRIRPLEEKDKEPWRSLWNKYCAFYGESVSDDVTDDVWIRLLNPASGYRAFVAVDSDDRLLGFSHSLVHGHTWSSKMLCYLEDLFVREDARGRNVGHRLIEHLIELGKANGWNRVYWHTDTDNSTARRLYNRFAAADEVVRYTVRLP